MSIARQMMMAAAGGAGGGGGGLPVADVFSTDLYTGNGSTQTITNGIDLAGEGGLVWLKNRSASVTHKSFDTDPEMTFSSALELEPSKTAAAASNRANTIRADSSGFTLGTLSYFSSYNASFTDYVAWTFRKAPRFFDVVTYTGDGVAGRTIPHNLGVEPGMIVVKKRNVAGTDWFVYHRSIPETQSLALNEARAASTNIAWNNTSPTDSVFSVGNYNPTNNSGDAYVAYLFAHDTKADGVIQCGSYTGNGSTNGPVISLGWEPQWLMIKRSDSTGDWYMFDSERGIGVGNDGVLYANRSDAESTAADIIQSSATSFQIKNSGTGFNASGGSYIYIAIRKEDA